MGGRLGCLAPVASSARGPSGLKGQFREEMPEDRDPYLDERATRSKLGAAVEVAPTVGVIRRPKRPGREQAARSPRPQAVAERSWQPVRAIVQ